MRKGSLVSGVIVLLSCVAYGQQQTVIKGTIRDSEGAALAHATVLFHWDPAGSMVGLSDNLGIKNNIAVVTDTEGRYSAAIPPGFYDVFVSATAFTPTAAKVRVKAGIPTTYDSKLRVDPLVSRELAN